MGIQIAIWGEAKRLLLLTILYFSLKYNVFYAKMQNLYSGGILVTGKKPTCFDKSVTFIQISFLSC